MKNVILKMLDRVDIMIEKEENGEQENKTKYYIEKQKMKDFQI